MLPVPTHPQPTYHQKRHDVGTFATSLIKLQTRDTVGNTRRDKRGTFFFKRALNNVVPSSQLVCMVPWFAVGRVR